MTVQTLPEAADVAHAYNTLKARERDELERLRQACDRWQSEYNDLLDAIREVRDQRNDLRDKLAACHESARKWHRGAVQGYRLAKAVERAAQSKYGLWFGNVKARKLYDIIRCYRRGEL